MDAGPWKDITERATAAIAELVQNCPGNQMLVYPYHAVSSISWSLVVKEYEILFLRRHVCSEKQSIVDMVASGCLNFLK